MGREVKKLLDMPIDDSMLRLIPRDVMEKNKLVDSFTGYGEDYYMKYQFQRLMKKHQYHPNATKRAKHSMT